MPNIQEIKQRFGIIGNTPALNRALEKASMVAPTDISVLVTGESGVGKENIPKIIHAYSHRKHAPYIAVNCGAIPEGTIDSELFGHEKGAFTGATATRKGYFEEADGGTIFLDEVGELPLTTQVRLLRVLETGEFIKVGSSKVQKTDVRIIAATNVDMHSAIGKKKFREDLFYRLNTVEISLPALRDRHEDIHLLFRKFSIDFAEKYQMPPVRLLPDAIELLENYPWPGNIRQLRNFTEQISVVESNKSVDAVTMTHYLPKQSSSQIPAVLNEEQGSSSTNFNNEREMLYKVLFDLRNEMQNLKDLVFDVIKHSGIQITPIQEELISRLKNEFTPAARTTQQDPPKEKIITPPNEVVPIKALPSHVEAEGAFESDAFEVYEDVVADEPQSLHEKELEMIRSSLERNRGRRKDAAKELGISERTLYRKIKQYNL